MSHGIKNISKSFFKFDDEKKMCTWPKQITIAVGDLEVTSETLNDFEAIGDYLQCLWSCTQAQKWFQRQHRCSSHD